jgi:hypothetical protein
MTAVAVILAVYTIALGIWAAWHIRQLWQAATRVITPADLEILIDAEREYYGLAPRRTGCRACSWDGVTPGTCAGTQRPCVPAYADTELEALARDAARRAGCPLCQVEDEAAK